MGHGTVFNWNLETCFYIYVFVIIRLSGSHATAPCAKRQTDVTTEMEVLFERDVKIVKLKTDFGRNCQIDNTSGYRRGSI